MKHPVRRFLWSSLHSIHSQISNILSPLKYTILHPVGNIKLAGLYINDDYKIKNENSRFRNFLVF